MMDGVYIILVMYSPEKKSQEIIHQRRETHHFLDLISKPTVELTWEERKQTQVLNGKGIGTSYI
jgi:hypothetical protein